MRELVKKAYWDFFSRDANVKNNQARFLDFP